MTESLMSVERSELCDKGSLETETWAVLMVPEKIEQTYL